MKIKVGDKVKFLNDTGSGTVTRIVDQKTALVQIDGGFEVPWQIRDLVVAAGSYNIEDEDEDYRDDTKKETEMSFSEKISTEQVDEVFEDEELVFSFVPEDKGSGFETYLINSSSYQFKYTIARQQEGEMVLFHEGNLEPGIKIELGNYLPGNVNDEECFRIQGIFFNNGFYRNVAPLDIMIRIAASEMYDASRWTENDYFYEKAIIHVLHSWKEPIKEPAVKIDADELRKAMFTKGDLKEVKKNKEQEKKPGIEEVDLHIEQLVDNHSSMENGEILEIQMAKFRTSLESAIIHKMKKIVFIHGVGNGKLKLELRRALDHEYKNVRYQDASFKEYGYGATMVLIH